MPSHEAAIREALAALGGEVLQIGRGRASFHSLHDSWPELPRMPLRPAGFAVAGADGTLRTSDGMPWWLAGLRPQGFLGRAFAMRQAAALGLPADVNAWSDRQVLRALATQGHDAAGEVPGYSAGGEQPKFTAFVDTAHGPAHVLVKFSLPEANALAMRWRDLLLAEHLARPVLHEGGLAAARSGWVDHAGQRFLQVERFDRVGALGRRALHSLGSLDDEFTGDRGAPWPVAVQALVRRRLVVPASLPAVQQLYAFGVLIANTDMDVGNPSFFSTPGQPCALAPAYDMLPMALAPTAAGALRDSLPPLQLPACVPLATGHPALALANEWLARLQAAARAGQVSAAFAPALAALRSRVAEAGGEVGRMAP